MCLDFNVVFVVQLHLSVTEAQSAALQMQQELISLEKERDAAQKTTVQLQVCLDQLTQVRKLRLLTQKVQIILCHSSLKKY